MKLIVYPIGEVLTLHPSFHDASTLLMYTRRLSNDPARKLGGVYALCSDVEHDGGEAFMHLLKQKPDALILDLTLAANSLGETVLDDYAARNRYNVFRINYNECIFGNSYWEDRTFVVLLRQGIRTDFVLRHSPRRLEGWRPRWRQSEFCSLEAAMWILETVERNCYHPRSFFRIGRETKLHTDAFTLRRGYSAWIGPTREMWIRWPVET